MLHHTAVSRLLFLTRNHSRHSLTLSHITVTRSIVLSRTQSLRNYTRIHTVTGYLLPVNKLINNDIK